MKYFLDYNSTVITNSIKQINKKKLLYKAELLREGIIFLIHLFARATLLMKKLKIEELKQPSI